MSIQEKKNKSITEAIRAIHKQFGSGSIMRLDGSEVQQVEVIPTGSIALDVALGCGGLPRGRIVEIYGPESSGKTTLTLHAIAEAQRAGGVCAFIDAEHALDTEYARRLGVDLEDLLVSQPDCGEQALEIADTLVRTGAIDLIVVDSVAALTPRAEIEGEMGDSHMGLQARLMSQALRKLTAVDLADADDRHLHQPAAPEDRRRLRQPRDHDRRQRAQVLLLGAARHPPQEGRSSAATRRSAASARSRSSRTSSRRRSARPTSRSSTAPASTSSASSSTPPRSSASSRRSAPGTRTRANKIGQGRDKALAHLDEHPRMPQQLRDALVKQARHTAASHATTATNGVVS